MEETSRRRAIQEEYNTKNGLSPQKIYTRSRTAFRRGKNWRDENLPSDEFLAEYLNNLNRDLSWPAKFAIWKSGRDKNQDDEVKNKIPNE